ncbi:MAP7 domain-containing protein 2-like [Rhopilema esculentum]|uniref:MAP7 domain-containing protein 2-like n=1 Tax=Rhopilema esculentum TaxID=499914 RepID=UPI0031D2814C
MADGNTDTQPEVNDVTQEPNQEDTPSQSEVNSPTANQAEPGTEETISADKGPATEEGQSEKQDQQLEATGEKTEPVKSPEKEGEGTSSDKETTPKAQRTPPFDRKAPRKDDISDDQRKAKIEELRKKKITDYKKKEDEKRKAVLERKKKLEEAEKAKQEALLKKIAGPSTAPPKRPASAPARRAASFSSLAYLKKTHAVAKEIDIDSKKPEKAKEAEDKVPKPSMDQDRRRTLPSRPRSAMERKRPNSFSSDKPKPSVQKNATEASTVQKNATAAVGSRPRSSFGTRAEPKIRQSLTNLPHRPPSASANRHAAKPEENKQKTATTRPRPMPTLPGKPLVPPNKEKEMKKAKSASSVVHHGIQDKNKRPLSLEKQDGEKTKGKTEAAKPAASKPKADAADKPKTSTGKGRDPEKNERRRSNEGSHAKAEGPKKPGIQNEADAKRLLAEKRRQVKEEAERKALIEQDRLEEERIRKEEEQKKREEELRKEEERQKMHLEELKREAEERERKEQEDKERKEMEEKERIEAEKRQRQEDIERRAQEEVERRAKEREHKRQQEEADRMERKRRVQEILGSRIRGSPVSERPVSPTPFATGSPEEAPGESSPPVIDSANSARDRVQKLLEKNQRRSGDSQNGFGEEESLEGEVVKPAAVSAKPSVNEQAISNENKFEDVASLTEADKQALEDAKEGEEKDESSDATVNGLENNFNKDAAINKNEENQNMSSSIEEKKLWNDAENIMAENQENLINSLDKNNSSKSEQDQSNEENRLWQLVEGQLELEECF